MYYLKALKFINNATSTEGFYEGIRVILKEAMEAEIPLKNTYPEDWQVKKIQRAADAKFKELTESETIPLF